MKIKQLQLLLTGVFITLSHMIFAFNAQDGYEIKIKIKDYDKDTLFLGYQMGNQYYIRDTAVLDKASGFYVFKGERRLESGIYFLMMEKNENLCELVISEKEEQVFSLTTQLKEPLKEIRLKNSPENDIFFDYVRFLNKKSKEAEGVQQQRAKDSVGSVQKLQIIDKDVKSFQKSLIDKHNKTITGSFIKSTLDIDVPSFEDVKDKDERQLQQYFFYKKNYFNNIDLANPALLRTPTLYQKVNFYMEKMTSPQPDSIIQSLDRVFELMQPSEATFSFYFLHYFNQYIKANLVGYDAITTHLSLQYIAKGRTPFINKYDSLRLVDNAKKAAPLLIGKKAPQLTTFDIDNKAVNLHDIKAKYTILYFFAHDCGHCAKQSPHVAAYPSKAKAKNIDVKILTICSNPIEEKQKCWDYTKEKGFDNCINTIDPYDLRHKNFDVYMTPKIFILDENKIIRSKDINGEQLDEVMDMIIEEENMRLKKMLRKD